MSDRKWRAATEQDSELLVQASIRPDRSWPTVTELQDWLDQAANLILQDRLFIRLNDRTVWIMEDTEEQLWSFLDWMLGVSDNPCVLPIDATTERQLAKAVQDAVNSETED